MRRSLLAVLLVPVLVIPALLVGCRREPIVVSETQRAVCRQDAEAAPTPEEGLQRQARCIAAAIEAARKAPPQAQAPPAVPAAPPAQAPGFNRYLYCRVHQDDVIEAAARYTSVSKPWLLASKRLSPSSEEYLTAQRNYNAALAELEELLPPQVRNGMDLLPTAVNVFSRCDREELEGPTP